ncbi:hypothetical protein MPSEU_000248000 [Mayamaea pseudoterrestris]|nr:hypothetical protein MPSEU_000248000 [Mayamaea pseudoterrestris]
MTMASITEAPEALLRKDSIVDDCTKRLVVVVDPESHNGNVEYKRQVSASNPSRLRTLTTQMSFRMDEGHGRCIYRIGVEDNGCHSLLSYDQVAESARILEYLARSLNAIVVERKMIQNEVMWNAATGEPERCTADAIAVDEAPILGDAMGNPVDIISESKEDGHVLNKEEGIYTRAELTIHRIETHLLDPSPMQLKSKSSHSDAAKSDKPVEHKEEEKVAPASEEKFSVSETMSARNIRIAVVGNVDAGKSTLIGTLTTSCLDDGRGKSRTAIMKHRHEIESGRTSTATTHLMGFRSSGQPIAGRDQIRANKRKGEDEIARESYRVITLMDLAGHEKYLKTTIHGVSSGFSDYALILVNARQPPTHMTAHHLNLCCSFGIPVLVIFTKVDGCPEHAFQSCKQDVMKMLRSPEVARKPFMIRNDNDIETVMDKLHTLAPMIETSCVSGAGIDLLQKMLFALPKRRKHENKLNRDFEFLVEDIFNVPGVGAVVSGFVNAGELTVGGSCHVLVGPTDDGTFVKTVAKSAHIARINTSHVTAGQSACLALSMNKDMRKKLRRGMVVVKTNPTSTLQFDAEICVLKGDSTTIRRSYQAFVHILNVRQSAFAREIEIVNHFATGAPHAYKDLEEEGCIVLRPGSRAKVRFEFAKRPEYIRAGMRMLFRDGRVRGVGIVTGIPTTD